MIAMFGIPKALGAVFGHGFLHQSEPAPQSFGHLCHRGESESFTFISTDIDRRSHHAVAVFEVKTHEGEVVKASLSGPDLGEALKSYPESEYETSSVKVLRSAALEVQSHDCEIHRQGRWGSNFQSNLPY